jgi:two-component system, response regulator
MNSEELDILLVEDNQDDMDLALHALRREKLANNIFVACDGEEALDFLFCRGAFGHRSLDHPPKLTARFETTQSGRHGIAQGDQK